MTDIVAHRLELTIREATAHRHDVDPPDRDTCAWLLAQLAHQAIDLRRDDVLRLEVLIERRTGCARRIL